MVRQPTASAANGIAGLRRLAGRVSLDFVNTIDPRHGHRSHEFLESYPDLVTWATEARVLSARDADRLLAEADRSPETTSAALASAHRVRETLHRVFSAIATGSSPAPSDLQALSRVYADAMAHARLVVASEGFNWTWENEPDAQEAMLWPIIRDAVDLLTTGRLARIKECPGADGCGWLFYDTSRNATRRWCSMEVCGNRSKGRRHYQRHLPTSPRTPDAEGQSS